MFGHVWRHSQWVTTALPSSTECMRGNKSSAVPIQAKMFTSLGHNRYASHVPVWKSLVSVWVSLTPFRAWLMVIRRISICFTQRVLKSTPHGASMVPIMPSGWNRHNDNTRFCNAPNASKALYIKHYNNTQPTWIMHYISVSLPLPCIHPPAHTHIHPPTLSLSHPLSQPLASLSLSLS